MIRYRFVLYTMGLLVAVGLAQCGTGTRGAALTIKGSDTMVILVQRWAEKYMDEHPGAVVQVTGGGSGTGFAALLNGTTDICQASRSIKDDENQQLTTRFGQPATEIVMARDGLAIYLPESNPIQSLTIAQLRDLYTGRTTNWKMVGGPDAPITLYSRENNSGTYAYFKEHVLENGDFAASAQTLPGTAAVVNAVLHDPNGIGYGGDAYAKGIKLLALRREADSPAILPGTATVEDGSYPLARPLFFYTRKVPEGPAQAFIDYCLSGEGQQIVSEVGYFPVH